MRTNPLTRRRFLYTAAGSALAVKALAQSDSSPKPNEQNFVQLAKVNGVAEQNEKAPGPFLPDSERVGFAIVGLGRLAIDQILPAFGHSQYCKPVAFVTGHPDKGQKLARQYGVPEASIYSYENYERLQDNPAVKIIYIVLPNGMHEEYVVRGAKTGKHILCEKPMAVSSKQAEHMIAACKSAGVKLMIAYRQQYEPHNIALRELVQEGKLGPLRGFLSTNSQQQGDPTQWRLKRALSGGGCLPDVGLYCLNAARFLSGEEPSEVAANLYQPTGDPRFTEVEASCSFSLVFPSGYIATCTSSYDVHKSQSYRLEGTTAWAELSPAYAYHGNKLTWSHLDNGEESQLTPQIEEKDQFALEMDHFAQCILEGKESKTPGEEGLRDHRIMEAIYNAARTGNRVKLTA
jgi:predicted dehydrogenase